MDSSTVLFALFNPGVIIMLFIALYFWVRSRACTQILEALENQKTSTNFDETIRSQWVDRFGEPLIVYTESDPEYAEYEFRACKYPKDFSRFISGDIECLDPTVRPARLVFEKENTTNKIEVYKSERERLRDQIDKRRPLVEKKLREFA